MNGLNVNSTFIHSQYVKYLEMAGAMVVPIHYNTPEDELYQIMEKVNGVLFTGGALAFFSEEHVLTPFAITATKILQKVKQLNDDGVHFPLWGTCLGHQLLMFLESQNFDFLSSSPSSRTNDNLIFKIPNLEDSKLFGSFPKEILKAAETEELTPNFHHYGVFEETFHSIGLDSTVTLLATSVDDNGKQYVANTEFKSYPIFTAQYHPEVTAGTFAYPNTNHGEKAREFMFLLAEKFVGEAKKNDQSYDSYEQMVEALVQSQGYIKLSGKGQGDGIAGGEFRDNFYFENSNKEMVMVSE